MKWNGAEMVQSSNYLQENFYKSIRVQEAPGSNPGTPTKNPLFSCENSGFFLFFVAKFQVLSFIAKFDH